MIIKVADDKSSEIATLQSFLTRPDLANDTKKRIEQEIKNIQAGLKGEREAAYEMSFHYEASKNWVLIHDLRLQCDGRVAQIDHLVINRMMEIWVCESKHFSEGIAINEYGECSAFYGGKPYGVASPFEQNKKHISVLESIFKTGLVKLPTRLGFNIKPTISSLILVSKNARITRPKASIAGAETIIKNDQFKAQIDKFREADNNPLHLAKLISCEALENFAQKIAELHIPVSFDWYGKFGLTRVAPNYSSVNQPAANYAVVQTTEGPKLEPEKNNVAETTKKKLICHQCGIAITNTVASFCRFNKPRFSGNIFCMECQKNI